jgi:glycosyltransferase involved in cell wall biosynthesis
VADFRDLWIDEPRYQEPSAKRRIAHRQLQQEFLEMADVVIGNTQRQMEKLASYVPEAKGKFIAIPNGFDPADFENQVRGPRGGDRPDDGVFSLAYVGRLCRWRVGEPLFAGLRRFVHSLGADRSRFEFHLIGHVGTDALRDIRATGATVRVAPYVPHAEAIERMCASDALLIAAQGGHECAPFFTPAKVYEYLASGTPVLVIGPPDGEAERIVQSCQAGVAVGIDEREIASALRRMFDAWQSDHPMSGADPSRIDRYSRIAQTRRLADVFNRLTAESNTRNQAALVGATRPQDANSLDAGGVLHSGDWMIESDEDEMSEHTEDKQGDDERAAAAATQNAPKAGVR